MISVANLTMHYGQKVLFEDVTMNFDPAKRYGLVGANGSGKSTFLRVLSGDEVQVEGSVSIPKDVKLGVLRQDHFQYEEQRVMDVVIQGKPALWKALQEKETLLHDHATEDDGHRLAALEEIIAHYDGYQAESFAHELLSGLGIVLERHEGPMKALSGGFKLRVLLAQVLFGEPDVLLLDEPTNHLDIVSIRWLEYFLKNSFPGTLLVISHDRDFLNGVCTHIIDVDYETLTPYVGNYERFVAGKELAMEQKLKEIASQEKKVAELQAFVDRFGAKASKARQAQSRVRQIEKIEIAEVKRSSRVSPHVRFEQKRPSGKEVLTIEELSKAFGDKQVLQGLSFSVNRGERLGLIGPNGIGKSTLLKILLGHQTADHGKFQWGYETYVSYFAQDHHEMLKGKASVYEWLYQFAPEATISQIRGLLGRMLFSGDDAHKLISALSGGEAARLLLAKMILEQGNVLVLDEPTNHLDLEGIAALEEALKAYQGTVIFVSHDRHFVSSLATRIIELRPEGMRDFPGSYADYLNQFGDDYLDREQVNLRQREGKAANKAAPLSYEEKKELKKQVNQLAKQISKLEDKISQQERQIAELDARFAASDFFQKHSREQVRGLQKQKDELAAQLSLTMQEWEKINQQLESSKQRLGDE